MAARSPPSVLPPPPPRRLGPGSPRVGRVTVVHAVSSEALGLDGAAREGVVDKSDLSWRGEEGSGGRRGPEWAAPAQAPLLSAPTGSDRLEGISVEEAMVTRTQLLAEELSSLKEELALCQVSTPLAAGLSPPQRGRGWWDVRPCPSAVRCAAARVGTQPAPPGGALSRLPPHPARRSVLEGRSSAQLPHLWLPAPLWTPRLRLGSLGSVFFTWIPPGRAGASSIPQ